MMTSANASVSVLLSLDKMFYFEEQKAIKTCDENGSFSKTENSSYIRMNTRTRIRTSVVSNEFRQSHTSYVSLSKTGVLSLTSDIEMSTRIDPDFGGFPPSRATTAT